MQRSTRWLAAFLLMLLLPIQGLAAACAQVCMKAQAAALMAAPSQGDGEPAHDCHGSANHDGQGVPGVPGEGKCCHAHTVMAPPQVAVIDVPPPVPHPPHFVARWTSFIPEEPSPPPIASAA